MAARSNVGQRCSNGAGSWLVLSVLSVLPPWRPLLSKEAWQAAVQSVQTSGVGNGLSCWPAVTKADIDHFPMRAGSGRKAVQWVPFKWVSTMLGNITDAITGTCYHVSPKHAERYVTSFAYRLRP